MCSTNGCSTNKQNQKCISGVIKLVHTFRSSAFCDFFEKFRANNVEKRKTQRQAEVLLK